MAKDYMALANGVVEKLGGKENILLCFHCVTRLRFNVKDMSLIDVKVLKQIQGVLGAQIVGDQVQIIIGQDVDIAYKTVCKVLGIKEEAAIDENLDSQGKKKFSVKNIMAVFTPCIVPCLNIILAGGLIRGLLSLLSVFHLISPESGTYIVLFALSNAFYYFMPIYIGFNAGKVFNCNQFITATIGAALIYPTIVGAVGGETTLTFFGIPMLLMNYTQSLLPVIAASAVAAPLERWLKKHCPKVISMMVVPTVTLLIMVPLTLLVIGPVMSGIIFVLKTIVTWFWGYVPVVVGVIFGGLWQPFTLVGLHAAFTPLSIALMAELGYDVLGISVTSSMIGLVGVCLAAFLLEKGEEKGASLSAMVSAAVGVTEPALFAVALRRKRLIFCAMLGGAVGGAVGNLLNVRIFGRGANSFLQILLTFTEEGMANTICWIISIAAALTVSFVSAYILIKKDMANEKSGN